MNITPTVPAREDVLLILFFCLVFGSVNSVNARPSSASFQPETSVDIVVKHNSEPSKKNQSDSTNVSQTHVYREGISGFAGNVSLEHLGETLSDPQIDHAILDYFMEPSGLSTADESSNNRKNNGAGIPPSEVPGYLQAINASNLNPKDVPLNDVHVGVIDLISNPDHPVIKNASNIHHVPSRSKEEAKAVSSTLTSYENNHIHHGTRSAGIIGGKKKTGIAPGIHLHLFSTAHAAVQDIQNADEPRNESIEEVTENADARVSTVLHGLEYYSRKISRNTPIDVLLLNLATEDASHRQILRESIRNLKQKGVMIITPAGNEGETINGGFLAKDTIPAVFSETFTVTARTLNDGTYNQIADWSNYGTSTADLSAPGESYGSITYNGTNRNESGKAQGTSYAAAVVTGASAYLIGLAKKHDLPLSNEALTTLLKRTGTRTETQNSNHELRNKPAVNLGDC